MPQKPLLFANSDNDSIFPMDGNRRIIARLRTCYDMLGSKGNVDDYVSKGGHDYRPDLRIAVFSFLNKHLKGEVGTVKDADFPKIDGKDLRVFPEEKDLPKDAINATVDEVFVPKAEVKLPEKKEDFAAWKAGMVKRLRETSFRAIPEQVPTMKEIRSRNGESEDFSAEVGMEFFGKMIHANVDGDKTGTLVVMNPDDDASIEGANWTKRHPNATTIYGIFPRGGGPNKWTRKNPPNTIERSLVLVGQTVDGARVRDIASILSARVDHKKGASEYRLCWPCSGRHHCC